MNAAARASGEGGKGLVSLTKREREVLGLIGQGMSLPEIAERLYRSQKTIESHRLALGRKLGASNRVELARIAIQAGLAPLEQIEPPAAGRGAQTEAGDDALRQQVMRQSHAWEALLAIETATAPTAGPGYIRKLLATLADQLDLRCAALAQVLPEDTGSARVFVACGPNGGELAEPIETDLAGTAFEPALRKRVVRLEGDARRKHPRDPVLQTYHADSFVSVRLTDSRKRAVGVLAVLHTGPIRDGIDPELILRVCASRAAAELERIDVEQRLRQAQEQLESRVQEQFAELRAANSELRKQVAQRRRTEADLRFEQYRYRELIQTMREGFVVLDADGVITLANPAMGRLLGMEPEEMVGRPAADLFPGPEREKFFARQPEREAGTLGRYAAELRRADGSTIRVVVSPKSLFDEEGRYRGSFGTVSDLATWPRQPGDTRP